MNNNAVLLTGNLGYIGSVMTSLLSEKGYAVTGLDIGYYEDCYLEAMPSCLRKQIKKDIRDIEAADLQGFDFVIHLAGLSNDPLGEFNASLTEEINYAATVRLAEHAKAAGVKRFLYASSQSVYGVSDTSREVDEDSEKNPLTAYAVSKWKSECALFPMAAEEFIVTCLRPATAYGASPNYRADIVFNAFMGYAYTSGLIEIKSDGTPWRPMSHIRDISAAFIACLEAPGELVQKQVFNVGTDSNNYTVRDLAEVAAKCVPGATLTFTGEHTDSRSYRVSSQKILTVLREYYRPQWDIHKGAEELLAFFKRVAYEKETFESYKCTRLKALKKQLEEGYLTPLLRRQ